MNPKLKENIWRIDHDRCAATLITGGQAFDIPFPAALTFMEIRPFCTGHHSIESIAGHANIGAEPIRDLLRSLAPSGMILNPDKHIEPVQHTVRQNVLTAVAAWSGELSASYIGNEIGHGKLSRTVLTGWLLEMYHYIRHFPEAIKVAQDSAPAALKPIYQKYCMEETGHEHFVLETLMRLGLSRAEVEQSAPLVSTRSIGLLMKDLFSREPIALLIVAALIEAQEFNESAIARFKTALGEHYGVAADTLDPYFKHQEIDVQLGHSELLESNIEWLDLLSATSLDTVVDGAHDIKHAFEVQSLEIKSYYGALNGKYFPRQPMPYHAIG